MRFLSFAQNVDEVPAAPILDCVVKIVGRASVVSTKEMDKVLCGFEHVGLLLRLDGQARFLRRFDLLFDLFGGWCVDVVVAQVANIELILDLFRVLLACDLAVRLKRDESLLPFSGPLRVCQ